MAFAGVLLIASAMGTACAVLSVFVVLRRWAFIGEGIAHAGFGGAGTAWMLSLLFPASEILRTQAGIYPIAIIFCLLVALGIAATTRRQHVHADTAIGIFMVASLAWGFVAYRIYSVRRGVEPPAWGDYLFGQMSTLSAGYVGVATCVCVAVVLAVVFLRKEIVAYCFDPALAQVSGVRVGFIHYALILLLAVCIIIGIRVMGPVLVTALLVLPGATAIMLSRKLSAVMGSSIVVGLVATIAGPLIGRAWPVIPDGPAIVGALVAEFVLVYVARRFLIRGS